MHPDAIIAGLRRELERLHPDHEDYAERKAAIEQEIARVDDQPRPEATPEQPETVVDTNVSYLEGLRKELARAGSEAKESAKQHIAEIKAEIRRVEAEIKEPKPEPVAEPAEPETPAAPVAEPENAAPAA